MDTLKYYDQSIIKDFIFSAKVDDDKCEIPHLIPAEIDMATFHDIIVYCLDNGVDYDTFANGINIICNFVDPNSVFEKYLMFKKESHDNSCLVLKIVKNDEYEHLYPNVYEDINCFFELQKTKSLFFEGKDVKVDIIFDY